MNDAGNHDANSSESASPAVADVNVDVNDSEVDSNVQADADDSEFDHDRAVDSDHDDEVEPQGLDLVAEMISTISGNTNMMIADSNDHRAAQRDDAAAAVVSTHSKIDDASARVSEHLDTLRDDMRAASSSLSTAAQKSTKVLQDTVNGSEYRMSQLIEHRSQFDFMQLNRIGNGMTQNIAVAGRSVSSAVAKINQTSGQMSRIASNTAKTVELMSDQRAIDAKTSTLHTNISNLLVQSKLENDRLTSEVSDLRHKISKRHEQDEQISRQHSDDELARVTALLAAARARQKELNELFEAAERMRMERMTPNTNELGMFSQNRRNLEYGVTMASGPRRLHSNLPTAVFVPQPRTTIKSHDARMITEVAHHEVLAHVSDTFSAILLPMSAHFGLIELATRAGIVDIFNRVLDATNTPEAMQSLGFDCRTMTDVTKQKEAYRRTLPAQYGINCGVIEMKMVCAFTNNAINFFVTAPMQQFGYYQKNQRDKLATVMQADFQRVSCSLGGPVLPPTVIIAIQQLRIIPSNALVEETILHHVGSTSITMATEEHLNLLAPPSFAWQSDQSKGIPNVTYHVVDDLQQRWGHNFESSFVKVLQHSVQHGRDLWRPQLINQADHLTGVPFTRRPPPMRLATPKKGQPQQPNPNYQLSLSVCPSPSSSSSQSTVHYSSSTPSRSAPFQISSTSSISHQPWSWYMLSHPYVNKLISRSHIASTEQQWLGIMEANNREPVQTFDTHPSSSIRSSILHSTPMTRMIGDDFVHEGINPFAELQPRATPGTISFIAKVFDHAGFRRDVDSGVIASGSNKLDQYWVEDSGIVRPHHDGQATSFMYYM